MVRLEFILGGVWFTIFYDSSQLEPHILRVGLVPIKRREGTRIGDDFENNARFGGT